MPTPLNHEQVHVKDAFVLDCFQKDRNYLFSLEPDRLLAGFMETAGLPPRAPRYGGWESTEIQGHTLGHYMTALAQGWCVSHEPEFLDRIRYIVDTLAVCQRSDGFLFASPEDLFDRVEQRQPAWVPWYTMHKILSGLTAAYNAAGYPPARTVLCRLCDWIAGRVLGWSEQTQRTVLAVEYGGMNDCLYDAYRITGNPRHAQAAHQFDELELFQALAQGRDVLNGLHANTTIPKLLGALKRYVVAEQDPLYLRAAENFWDIVTKHHTYVSGGNSEWEHFGKSDVLDAERTACNCETCNTYNMLKLSQLLFAVTGEKKYADYDAWTYVNAILSSQNHETGMTTYFQPMAAGYFKVYSRPFDQFWCCTGTGMENFTKPWTGVAYADETTLWITRLVSSEITLGELRLSVDADWLGGDRVEIRVLHPGAPRRIALRKPWWAVRCHAEPAGGCTASEQDGWILLDAMDHAGDGAVIRCEMELKRHPLPDHPCSAALSIGPFVLSAAFPSEDFSTTTTGVDVTVPEQKTPVEDALVRPVSMVPKAGRRFLARDAKGRKLLFSPHFLKNRERYGIYLYWFEPDSAPHRAYLEARERSRRIMAAQRDVIPLGNDQYELAHKVRGERTDSFARDNEKGRAVLPGGFVCYQMKLPDEVCELRGAFRGALHLLVSDSDGALLQEAAYTAKERQALSLSLPAGAAARTAVFRFENRSAHDVLELYEALYIVLPDRKA